MRLAGFLLWILGYTLRMSLPHEQNSSHQFDNVAALRALKLAQETLQIEADAVLAVMHRLTESADDPFARATALLLGRAGRGVVSGMGEGGPGPGGP